MYYKYACMYTYMYCLPCGLNCVSVRVRVRVRVAASTVSSTAHLDHGHWNSRYSYTLLSLVLIVATNNLCVHRIRTCE